MPTSLHCPNCGAPAEPETRRCAFCRARLATVSCPACFAPMFDTTAFCARCGTKRARTEQDDEAGMTCPGCGGALQRLALGGTVLLECAGCDGLWVDAEVFEALCADKAAQAAVLHQCAGGSSVTPDRVRYRRCPRCGTVMNRVNFGRISGTIVDVCRGHGTYLDPGELHRLVEFIQGGGLDRARARQIEELREHERRLRDAGRRLARDRGKAYAQSGRSRWDVWRLMVE